MDTSIRDLKKFIDFAAKKLKLRSMPKIHFVGKSENIRNAFGHFLASGKGNTISVRITDRHPIDVMRTIAHELIHYKQRENGEVSSEQMKEDEANALAGRIMREFDTTHPGVFKDMPIMRLREDGGVAAIGGAVNNVGDGNIAKFDPILGGNKKKIPVIKRKNPSDPVAEDNVISGLLGGNISGRTTAKSILGGKRLRDITRHEKNQERRADTRNS
jgi:hypothetical protein